MGGHSVANTVNSNSDATLGHSSSTSTYHLPFHTIPSTPPCFSVYNKNACSQLDYPLPEYTRGNSNLSEYPRGTSGISENPRGPNSTTPAEYSRGCGSSVRSTTSSTATRAGGPTALLQPVSTATGETTPPTPPLPFS